MSRTSPVPSKDWNFTASCPAVEIPPDDKDFHQFRPGRIICFTFILASGGEEHVVEIELLKGSSMTITKRKRTLVG